MRLREKNFFLPIIVRSSSPPIPHPRNLGLPHFLLQLQDPIHECFTCGWASGNINVDRDDPVASPDDTIRVMVIPATVGAGAHGDNPIIPC